MPEMYEYAFRREGSVYIYEVPDLKTRFEFRAPHGTGLEVRAEVATISSHPDMKTYENGLVLAPATINLLALATRKSYAVAVEGRFNGPVSEAKSKVGGIDWHGTFEHAAALALEAHRRGDPFVWLEPLPKTAGPRFVLPPFMPAAMPSMLFGQGETLKSLMALAFGVSVTSGQTVISGLPPAVQGPVLYLDWETTEPEASERVDLLCRGAGIPFKTGMVRYRSCRGPLYRMAEQIARDVDREGHVLIIIDAMLAAIGSSRDGQPMEEGTSRLFEALKEIRATALLIHHENRAGEQYGSVYNRNFARASWQVKRLYEDDHAVHLGLYHDKASTAKREQGGRGIRVQWPNGADRILIGQEPLTETAAAEVRASGGAARVADRMVEALLDAEHPLTYREIAQATGLDYDIVKMQANRDKRAKTPRFHDYGPTGLGLAHWAESDAAD